MSINTEDKVAYKVSPKQFAKLKYVKLKTS